MFDGSGDEWVAELDGQGAQLKRSIPGTTEPRTALTLFQALIKPARFELVLQKGTELGIGRFVPFLSERCVTTGARAERWRTIVTEAAEQSGRRIVPTVAEVRSFSEVLVEASAGSPAIMPWEGEVGATVASVYRPAPKSSLIVGPEGGFTPEEVEQARAHGAVTVSLGRRILRSETAAIVAATLLLHSSGEL